MADTGYTYKPYPRRLYLDGDPAKADIVVNDEFAEQVAKSRGYRIAYSPAEPGALKVPSFADATGDEQDDASSESGDPVGKKRGRKAGA